VLSSWVARLFLALALLQLLPVWAPAYFPTCDGPSHVYNAFVMRELVLRHDGPITAIYAIDWRPNPNILGHVVLAMLLGVFSAAVAEKILVSIIVLLFLGGAWMLARGSVYAFLAFPFAFHLLLEYGSYNFAIGVGIYLITLALWWERRERADGQSIALIALLSLLCYAAHAMPAMLLVGSIGLLWLARPRRQARQLLALVPLLPLLAWFFGHPRPGGGTRPKLAERAVALARFDILQTFDSVQLTLGAAMFGILVALIIVTVAAERRRRDEDAFAVLTAAVVALYFVAPDGAAGGLFLPQRLLTIVPILPLPWLTPRLPAPPRAALLVVLSAIAAGNAFFLAGHERAVARRTGAFVRAERGIPPSSSILVLNGERQPRGALVPFLAHASGYAAVQHRLADLENYEADTDFSPIRHRPRTPVIDRTALELDPASFDVDSFELADYVLVWHLPLLRGLESHYELISESAEARIYRHRDGDAVLLPIAGTLQPVDGTVERWSVEQTIANRGARPAAIHLSAGSGGPCDFVLGPGQSRRIAADADHPFIVARVSRDVVVRTIVERDGYDGSTSFLAIPSIPLRSFAQRSIDIPPVPLPNRLRLRLWIFGAAPPQFDLIALSEDGRTELKRLTIARPANGYFSGDVARLLAPLQGRVRLRIDAGAEAARVWAFVSEANSGDTPDALYLGYHPVP